MLSQGTEGNSSMKSFSAVVEAHKNTIAALNSQINQINASSQALCEILTNGNKILLCGNGGSAADAQHFAAELVVRFRLERRALPAIALTTDSSILTAHTNDYCFDTVFSRQVEALGNEGDCLIAISTSGNSPNVINAVKAARASGLRTIALTGGDGGALLDLADIAVVVPSKVTARIQEAHCLIVHWLCECIDQAFGEVKP